ncbi:MULTISPECIES: SDR family oxidoreductase [unclassified Haloferax]|uniref:SDR family oxidoreductase n=1 Tax=unclassified Haloferax TaxID=2625095 RepID=UPI002874DECB|nr:MULTISPECIES: SDR family oxidoreductase [unclassified Haloferax]MDS0239877.1 SDR family oxidoreductase [Haloferax sp. S2CR25]MDS0442998.1 SDR family oxidoreductase [Haloferax sp. S2CR25-2]
MQILVTGGSGFIGSHLAEYFVNEGHDVVALDVLDPFYNLELKKRNRKVAERSAEQTNGTYTFVEGSVLDTDLVGKLVSDVDAVFHQAAQAGVRNSVNNPTKVHEINVTGTMNLLEAARDTELTRFVNASSSSVYGKPKVLPYDEEHPTEPVSPYGASKLAAEHYTRVYHEVYGLPTVSLRYFTVYGPRMRPNMAFTNFVSRCIHGESPIIFGDGSQTRDFTYVEDIVDANARLLELDDADGVVLNIGSGDRITINELARFIRDEINSDIDIRYESSREGDAKHTHADIRKANKLLGYEPTVSIKEGARLFADWYRNNVDWYDALVRQS